MAVFLWVEDCTPFVYTRISPHPTRMITRRPALRFALILFLFLPAIAARLSAQHVCGTRERPEVPTTQDIYQHTGCHLPASGTIRALVLFIQTKNDTQQDPEWPLGELPKWADEYTRDIAAYFTTMSGGRLSLQLDIHPAGLTTFRSEYDYLNENKRLGEATKDLLKSLDTQIDFTQYDNWKSESRPYYVVPGTDGRVDLIIAIYRRCESGAFFYFSGVSDLNFAGYLPLNDNDKFIYGGSGSYDDAASSGITVTHSPGSGIVIGREWAVLVSVHEILHKVYGEGHPAELFGRLGVLSMSSGGLGMHSFERHMLGYIKYAVLPELQDTTITLHDYMSSGEAAAVPIPDAPGWYYALEFRNRTSRYDSAPAKGVYIARIYDSWSRSQKEIHIMPASGNWLWAVDTVKGGIFRTVEAPLLGYNNYQKIPVNGKPYYAAGWDGDPASAFTMAHSRLNPWTNPTTEFILRKDTIRPNIYITLRSMTDSTATIDVGHQPPAILGLDDAAPAESALGAPYPNPASASQSGSVYVPYMRHGSAPFSLRLCDALGRDVATLSSGSETHGVHTARLALAGLAPGMYWCVLRNGDMLRVQPLRVLR